MKKVFAILLIISTLLSVLASCQVKDPTQTGDVTAAETSYPHEDMVVASAADIVAKTDTLDIPVLYLRYFFIEALREFYSEYYQVITSYFDVYAPLHDQVPTAEGFTQYDTWFDYFLQLAKSALEHYAALYGQAVKSGFYLDDADVTDIEEILDGYAEDAASYGITFEEYINDTIDGLGDNVSREMMKDLLTFIKTAQRFSESKYEEYEYTDDDKNKVLSENKYDYLTVDYNICEIYPDSDQSDTDEVIAQSKVEALKKGNEYVKYLDEGKTFTEAYRLTFPDKKESEYKEFEENCTVTREPYYYYDGDEAKNTDESLWLYAEGRKAGEYTAFQDATGRVKVVQIIRLPYYDDLVLPNLRVVYISLQDGTYTEKTGKEKATEIADAIKASDDKQNTVISMVKEYSKDTNTVKNDGLLENVLPYYPYLTQDIIDWCYDEDRAVGDVMQTEYVYNSIVTGYFVVYLDSYGMEYWEYNLDTYLKNMKMDELVQLWISDLNITYDAEKTDSLYK